MSPIANGRFEVRRFVGPPPPLTVASCNLSYEGSLTGFTIKFLALPFRARMCTRIRPRARPFAGWVDECRKSVKTVLVYSMGDSLQCHRVAPGTRRRTHHAQRHARACTVRPGTTLHTQPSPPWRSVCES
eukprot:6030017-Prymnesium_polylepis.1